MEPQQNNPQSSTPPSPGRWAGLSVRIFSALVLGGIALLCILSGGIAFTAFILLIALVMKKEWDALLNRPSTLLRAGGYVYVILPCASLLWLRQLPGNAGVTAVVVLAVIISATDIGAYFVGRSFGRHKLSPVISPGKTWEGLMGGILAALVAAVFTTHYLPFASPIVTGLWLGPFMAILSQAGDLFESSIKRQAGVKDSGTLLPGHGGLLDRFDGYMFAAPVFALIMHSIFPV